MTDQLLKMFVNQLEALAFNSKCTGTVPEDMLQKNLLISQLQKEFKNIRLIQLQCQVTSLIRY